MNWRMHHAGPRPSERPLGVEPQHGSRITTTQPQSAVLQVTQLSLPETAVPRSRRRVIRERSIANLKARPVKRVLGVAMKRSILPTIIGRTVYSDAGESVGRVHDLVIA